MMWSCLPVCLFADILSGRMTVGDWAAAAAEMGLDAIDISILFVKARTPVAIGALRNEIERTGLKLAMMTTYPDFTQPEEAKREHELATAVSDIAVAAELGAEYVRVTAGQTQPYVDDEECIQWVVECLEVCCQRASRWGVKLLLENHSKPGAWERPDFDFHTGRFLKLVDATRHLPLGINFDTANTYALGDDAAAVFEAVYDRVWSIHVNDVRDRSRLEFVGIGDGGAPIGPIFQIARRKGFDGLLSIEESGADKLCGIARSFERSKALWDAAGNETRREESK